MTTYPRPDTLRVLTWPEAEPVTVEDAKAQIGLMVDQTDHDAILADKIAAGRRLIESRLQVTLAPTEYRATWRSAPKIIRLPAPPLLTGSDYPLAITIDGEAMDEADYEVDEDSTPAEITLSTGAGRKVVVTYWAGVDPGDPICPMLRAALLAYVDHAFNNRGIVADGSAVELPQAFETLLAASSWNGGW